MHIKVNVYSSLRYYMPVTERQNKEKDWDIPEDSPVSLVLEKMKLPKEVRVTVLVNDNSVDRKAILKEGDTVHILPQMAGG